MTTINHIFQPKQASLAAPELQTLSMPELYDTEFPMLQPIIQDLLYPGLYILAGAPKIGKSFLMAQLAYHVARGEQLWSYPVQQSGVLYLALEDKFYRLQQRLVRMFDMEVALSLLADGMSIDFAAKHSKLTVEEVRRLAEKRTA